MLKPNHRPPNSRLLNVLNEWYWNAEDILTPTGIVFFGLICLSGSLIFLKDSKFIYEFPMINLPYEAIIFTITLFFSVIFFLTLSYLITELHSRSNLKLSDVKYLRKNYQIDFQYLNFRRKRNFAAAFTFSGTAIFLFILGFVLYPSIEINAYLASIGILTFVITIAIAAILWHSWALVLIDILYDIVIGHQFIFNYWRKSRRNTVLGSENVKYLLGNRPCGYCGGKLAPIICNQCQSIQWTDLSPLKVEINNPLQYLNWYWSVAVFVTQYRWKLLTTVLSFAGIGILVFGFKVKEDQWQLRNENLNRVFTETQAVIDAMYTFRSSILELEVNCDNEITARCMDQFSKMSKAYFKLSWYAPSLLNRLEKLDSCKENYLLSMLRFSYSERSKAEKAACNLIRDRRVLSNGTSVGFSEHLDAFFRKYVNAFHQAKRGKINFQERQKIGRAFYREGRLLGCVVATLGSSLAPRKSEFTPYTDCANYIQDYSSGGFYTKIDSPLFWDPDYE